MLARWLILLLLPGLTGAAPDVLDLALGNGSGAELLRLDGRQVLSRGPLPASLKTPLGSLWKLFVYAYLVDRRLPDAGYACSGRDREEVYCCNPGERIDRDQALVRSCGLYFEAERLGLDATDWRRYWQAHEAAPWLLDLEGLNPATRVPVAELLGALAALPAQTEARRVLLDLTLSAADGQILSALGGRLRIKTWTWTAQGSTEEDGVRRGGFGGWLLDGTPVWAGATGTSHTVLARYAEILGQTLPTPWPREPGDCVEVDLFARYPVRLVRGADGAAADAGQLRGRYEVEFVKGNRLGIESGGELYLVGAGDPDRAGGRRLVARIPREEYVARVLDREAAARPVEAAKALTIAVRSYLRQNAARPGDCLSIPDSSASQRVAPRPASAQARAIAAWTSDLVLTGSQVTYHLERGGDGRLSWKEAVDRAEAGQRFDAILARAFPRATLARWDRQEGTCVPIPRAEAWLSDRRLRWREVLDAEPGYANPGPFAVCRLPGGNPRADHDRRRIYVRGLVSLQDRLDLTHEYLHMAFEGYPSGQDEHYIEGLARHLLLDNIP